MKKIIIAVIGICLVVLSSIMIINYPRMKNTGAAQSMTVQKSANMLADTAATAYQFKGYGDSNTDSGSIGSVAKNTSIKKIIKDANVAVEVKDSDEGFTKISAWVAGNGGYEFSRNASFNGKYKYISVVYKLPPEKLNSFLAFLEGAAKVKSSNINSNDITDQYYDSAARLENLKKGRDQLLEIQKKAEKIEDILKVQNELNNITGEIESLQGRINLWDKMIAESTVNLTIAEEADPIKAAEDLSWKFSSFDDVVRTAKNGFVWTTNMLVNIVVWAVIILVSILPAALIVVVVLLAIKFLRKKKE